MVNIHVHQYLLDTICNNGLDIFGCVKNLLKFTPAANSILNADYPFDLVVDVDVYPEKHSPPSYVYTSNQGIQSFLGFVII